MPPGDASPSPARITTAFIVCTLIWGSTFLVISVANDTVPPFWGVTLRLVIAGIVLAVAAIVTGQGLPTGKARAHAIAYGVLQFGGAFPLLYWGEKRVPSGLAAVLYATVPLSSALLSHWLRIESVTRKRVFGAVISLIGVAVIFSGELSRAVPLPALLACLASTLAAVCASLSFKAGPRQGVLGANAVACAAAIPINFAISMLAREPHALPSGFGSWFAVLYLALAGSVGAFVLWTWLVSHGSVTKLSFIAVLVPLIALTLGTLVHHEHLAPASLLGGLVVLVGVAVGLELGSRGGGGGH
jgi:drug/metabolite transporter (DMT)-like permease